MRLTLASVLRSGLMFLTRRAAEFLQAGIARRLDFEVHRSIVVVLARTHWRRENLLLGAIADAFEMGAECRIGRLVARLEAVLLDVGGHIAREVSVAGLAAGGGWNREQDGGEERDAASFMRLR